MLVPDSIMVRNPVILWNTSFSVWGDIFYLSELEVVGQDIDTDVMQASSSMRIHAWFLYLFRHAIRLNYISTSSPTFDPAQLQLDMNSLVRSPNYNQASAPTCDPHRIQLDIGSNVHSPNYSPALASTCDPHQLQFDIDSHVRSASYIQSDIGSQVRSRN